MLYWTIFLKFGGIEVQSTIQEMAQRLALRANSDPSFASALLADPTAAAISEFGRMPPTVNVSASRAANGLIEVKIDGKAEGAEMTAEELESVVGGDGFPGRIQFP
jgi:hypothetical protein